MAPPAIANSPMKSVETAEGAMPAFCMRLPLHQRGKIQEESMYYEHKKHDGWRIWSYIRTRMRFSEEISSEQTCLPLHQRGKIQEESMYYEHKKHDGWRIWSYIRTRMRFSEEISSEQT